VVEPGMDAFDNPAPRPTDSSDSQSLRTDTDRCPWGTISDGVTRTISKWVEPTGRPYAMQPRLSAIGAARGSESRPTQIKALRMSVGLFAAKKLITCYEAPAAR
jgi:hypothetical protein